MTVASHILLAQQGIRPLRQAEHTQLLGGSGLMRRNRAIPAFEQNARIVRADGRCFVVDFLWRDPRAVLEIDSLEHHFETLDWLATMDRHRALETLGYSVAHWAPSVVCAEPRRFVAEVAAWLAARTRTRIA